MGTLKKAFSYSTEWVILTGIWLLFVSKYDPTELVIGMAASAIALFAVVVVQREPIVYFKPYMKWVIQLWRLPKYMVTGTWELMLALYRQVFTREGAESVLRATDFDPGGETGGSQARRALAVTYTSITPNFVVLGIDKKNSLLIYHQVLKGPVLAVTKKLGAHR
jgi:hypothetical protein